MAPNGGGHSMLKGLVDVAGRELEIERLRTEIAIVLSPHIFAYLDHEPEPVSIVVDDVLARWQRRQADARTQELTAPLGFVNDYIGQIEWERDGDGKEVYREEFCRDGESGDDHYFERVWEAHVQSLRKQQ